MTHPSFPPCDQQHFQHLSHICLQPSVRNEMAAVTLSSSITFVHKTPGSGKNNLNLAGNCLGMALLGTGEPLAGDQCRC